MTKLDYHRHVLIENNQLFNLAQSYISFVVARYCDTNMGNKNLGSKVIRKSQAKTAPETPVLVT